MVKVTDDGVYPASRERIWRLIEAHGTDVQNIHPDITSSRPLDKEMTTFEQTSNMNGQTFKTVLKVTPSPPDKLTLEFLEGPMTGKMVNTYSDVPGGTKVVTECDMKSRMMDDRQLESVIRQTLTHNYDEDLRYLKTKLQ